MACLLGGIASRDQEKVQAKNRVDCNNVPFEWGPKQMEAQEKLITIITNAPVLVRPDPN